MPSGVPIHRPATGQTPLAWFQSFANNEGAFLRIENGSVLFRHGAFWRLREWEPKEADFRLAETKPATLEGYAALAGKMKKVQAFAFRPADGFLMKVSTDPIRNALPALQFYASLGANQAVAKSGRPIPLGTLGGLQRDKFLAALHGELDGGVVVGKGAQIDLQRDANSLALLITPRELTDPNRALQPGIEFLFGTGPQDGVVYRVLLGPNG